MQKYLMGHGIPQSQVSSPKRFTIHKNTIALAWPGLNRIAVVDMKKYEVTHMIGTAENADIGEDEMDIGARVLKIGGFHNDRGDNFKVIYSSRNATDTNGLSFHEVHFFEGRKRPFHHKHLVKSQKNPGGADGPSVEE
jgi:hypothetical protein